MYDIHKCSQKVKTCDDTAHSWTPLSDVRLLPSDYVMPFAERLKAHQLLIQVMLLASAWLGQD